MRLLFRCACAALLVVGAACSDDEDTPPPTTEAGATTTIAEDPELVPLVLVAGDLPDGFSESPDVDDTITAVCANEDASAGLQATGRSLAGYRRSEPTGASAIHLVFRFVDDDATTFVRQAAEILDRCSEIPDAQGLAFTYAPASESVSATLASTDASVTRYGVSAGSGSLSINLAVFRHDDLGELIAVLGVDTPRAELDALAAQAFTAATAKLPGP